MIEQHIQKIKNQNQYGKLIEVGAGCPVYNKLCQYPNTASKIILSAYSPNSWELNKTQYRHDENVRAISPQVCEKILHTELQNIDKKLNFVLINTIQIGNDEKTQTHGWFCLFESQNNIHSIKYYHFSINNKNYSRPELIEIISEIGIDIIQAQNNSEQLTNGYIDIILNNNLKIIKSDIINSFLHSLTNINNIDDTYSVFKSDGSVIRLNDLFRKLPENVCIFKGSFNPVHNHHINLINESEKYINGKCILEISIKNRDQNKLIEASNLLKRINILNSLGYDVIINNFGLYHYTYTNFIKHPDFKSNLYFCMGEDILDRFLRDEDATYTNTIDYVNKFIDKWKKCTFLIADRNDMNIKIRKEITNIKKISFESNNISSTHIRKLIEDNDIEEIKKHLGEDLTNLIIKQWK